MTLRVRVVELVCLGIVNAAVLAALAFGVVGSAAVPRGGLGRLLLLYAAAPTTPNAKRQSGEHGGAQQVNRYSISDQSGGATSA